MTKEEFMINQLAQRIAQLEADKVSLQAENQFLVQQANEIKEKQEKEDDENVDNK